MHLTSLSSWSLVSGRTLLMTAGIVRGNEDGTCSTQPGYNESGALQYLEEDAYGHLLLVGDPSRTASCVLSIPEHPSQSSH